MQRIYKAWLVEHRKMAFQMKVSDITNVCSWHRAAVAAHDNLKP